VRCALQSFATLQRQMSRSNYEGLYNQAKSLLCCTLADGTRDAWVAYTVASAFAGAHTAWQMTNDACYTGRRPFMQCPAGSGGVGLVASPSPAVHDGVM
jgi:hypothetical protein